MRAALIAAIDACRQGYARRLDPVAAAQGPVVIDEVPWSLSCGAVAGHYDAWAPTVAGRTRSGDVLLTASARMGDEADYLLHVAADPSADRRRSAVEHLLSGLDQAETVCAREDHVQRWGGGDLTVPEEWRRSVEGDAHDLGEVRGMLERHALSQARDLAAVRRRQLEAGLRLAQRALASRGEALGEARVGVEESSARQAYQRVSVETLATFEAIAARVTDGLLEGGQDITRARSEADAADATWRAAWVAERSRWTGGEPEEAGEQTR